MNLGNFPRLDFSLKTSLSNLLKSIFKNLHKSKIVSLLIIKIKNHNFNLFWDIFVKIFQIDMLLFYMANS